MVTALTGEFVILTLRFHKEGHYWVGECDELGTATDGRSLVKVTQDLGKLVALHLDGLERAGERERVFRERGIRLYTGRLPTEIARSVPVSETSETLIQLRALPLPFPRSEPVAV
jgi:hypothetical protein